MLARVRTNKPSSSRTSTSTLQCTYCKKTGHTANRCYKRLDDLDNKNAANYIEENPNEETELEAELAILAIDDESYDSWAFLKSFFPMLCNKGFSAQSSTLKIDYLCFLPVCFLSLVTLLFSSHFPSSRFELQGGVHASMSLVLQSICYFRPSLRVLV